jgi:hypothetical protein
MGMPQKLWISLQGYLFPIMTTSLVTLGWQFYLHPQHILRTKNYAEAAALVVRLALWSVFITPYFGLLGSMGVYLAYTWIASNYIFINFAVSHTHLPVVEKADTQVSHNTGLIILLLHQVLHLSLRRLHLPPLIQLKSLNDIYICTRVCY